MNQPEFRVRPVIRHVVTRYTQGPVLGVDGSTSGGSRGSIETLGEFDSEGYAEIVAEALRHRVAPMEYVVVRQRLGEIAADVMYAYSEAEVQVRLAEMAVPDGPPCHVFSRLRNMTLPA